MNAQAHGELAGFIWSVCNLLRGPYKRNDYRKEALSPNQTVHGCRLVTMAA